MTDRRPAMDKNVTFSDNHSLEIKHLRIKKDGHIAKRLGISPKINFCPLQMHASVAKILDNEVTFLKKENLFVITVQKL